MMPSSAVAIDQIRRALADHPARLITGPERGHAAVALLLRPAETGLELLFIERAHHPQDPWSGNLAFPGGRIDPGDAGARQAAERETREEIGLDLARADYLGQLDDIVGAYLPVRVSSFVYGLAKDAALAAALNHEVRDLFFVPLAELQNPGRHVTAAIDWNNGIRQSPAIDLLGSGRPLLWGITYRLTCQFMERLGMPAIPPVPEIPKAP
ncbi:NUDIX hydrolase [Trichloromonas sp.]|uniref:NUDIX hydrolase n=1 Tax=Trichloromonas sp. TaxID=3069249 RepID=UPI003D81960D